MSLLTGHALLLARVKRAAAIILLGAIVLLSGCGPKPSFPTDSLNLVELLRILPTQKEFTQSDTARTADLDAVIDAFAPQDLGDATRKQYEQLGFREGAIRTWTGPGGAKMTVVLSRWPSHMTAVNTGSGVAEILPIQAGARPWTPDQLRGARGAATTDADPHYTLSYAIQNIGAFVVTEGPVSDQSVIRTMQLLSKPLLAADDTL